MKGLYKVLTPLAPDYSGASSIFFDLNALIVVHDPGGCAGTIAAMDEPRWYGAKSTIFSSGLREMDAILGKDEAYIDKVLETQKILNKECIVLIGSPPQAIIGADLQGMAKTIREKSGKPTIAVEANGYDDYSKGIKRAYVKIEENFVDWPIEKKSRNINILGASPLDIGKHHNLESIRQVVEECGFKVISSWGMSSSIDNIKNAAHAGINLVVSHTGIEIAQIMFEKYGIPYITGVPVGKSNTLKLLKLLKNDYKSNNISMKSPGKNIGKILVIGEPILSLSIKSCLLSDFGTDNVKIASIFPIDEITQRERGELGTLMAGIDRGDIFVEKEDELINFINDDGINIIIGDPYYKELLVNKDKTFIPLPHIALSGRNFWDMNYQYIGEKGYQYFMERVGI